MEEEYTRTRVQGPPTAGHLQDIHTAIATAKYSSTGYGTRHYPAVTTTKPIAKVVRRTCEIGRLRQRRGRLGSYYNPPRLRSSHLTAADFHHQHTPIGIAFLTILDISLAPPPSLHYSLAGNPPLPIRLALQHQHGSVHVRPIQQLGAQYSTADTPISQHSTASSYKHPSTFIRNDYRLYQGLQAYDHRPIILLCSKFGRPRTATSARSEDHRRIPQHQISTL